MPDGHVNEVEEAEAVEELAELDVVRNHVGLDGDGGVVRAGGGGVEGGDPGDPRPKPGVLGQAGETSNQAPGSLADLERTANHCPRAA